MARADRMIKSECRFFGKNWQKKRYKVELDDKSDQNVYCKKKKEK